ncbi:MAG: CinA family nicotinamide mononucleotide deamidase-related protein [Bacteroidales bacterium]
MKVEIITIGDEILAGHIQNLNAHWLASHLTENGFDVRYITTLPDDINSVVEFFTIASSRSNIIFVTGGLGPTNDDITHQAITKFFGATWKFNQKVYDRIKEYLNEREYSFSGHNPSQAKVPANAQVFLNEIGTAPGLMLERGDTMFVFMPGVHSEMKKMARDLIVPQFKKKYLKENLLTEVIVTQGIPEVQLAEKLKEWEEKLPAGFSLAYLPGAGIVKLRITAIGNKREKIREIMDEKISLLQRIIPEYYVIQGNVTIEEVVGKLLAKYGETICTAESCTGGAISASIVSIPGSSDYYKGSIVAYSNAVKQCMLSIDENVIVRHGAVSQEVTEAMAKNAREIFNTDYAIAVSGIAGPSGGTEDKPVGTVWITVVSEKNTKSERFLFGKERDTNILKTKNASLNILRKMIVNKH